MKFVLINGNDISHLHTPQIPRAGDVVRLEEGDDPVQDFVVMRVVIYVSSKSDSIVDPYVFVREVKRAETEIDG